MTAETDNTELRAEVRRLRDEVERYRTATEDALQQLDWCIGYLVGCNKNRLARALGANRTYIRRHLLDRAEISPPTDSGAGEKSGRNA